MLGNFANPGLRFPLIGQKRPALFNSPTSTFAAAAVCVCVLLAYWVRYKYWLINGGLEPDYLAWARVHHYGGIAPAYTGAATAILEGRWSGINTAYPPGYPLFIALVKLTGVTDLQNFRLVQIGADSAGCALVYAICRDLRTSRFLAILGAFGYAIAPWWAWGSTVIMSEVVLPILTLVLMFLLLRARKLQRPSDWLIVGLAASAMALVRSELSVVFLPLAVFAILASPPGKRVAHTLASLAGFWIPWVTVASINYHLFGHFFVANSAFWYALFSGLGQLPNDYGYYTNDGKASTYLKSIGIVYHTPAAEAYWKSIYLAAWRDHPEFVLSTIWFRLKRILLEVNNPLSVFASVSNYIVYAPFLLGFTVVLLAWRRRFLDILIVAGPILLAIGSLAAIYVEHRYVRYASISYLIAIIVSLSIMGQLASTYIIRPTGYARHVSLVAKISLAILAILGTARPLSELASIAEQGQLEKSASRFEAASWNDAPNFKPGASGSSVEQAENARPHIKGSSQKIGYQGLSSIPTHGADLMIVDYDVELTGTAGYLGILAGDGSRFSTQKLLGDNTRSSGRLIASVQTPSVFIVFTATRPNTDLVVTSAKYALFCTDHWSALRQDPIGYFFGLLTYESEDQLRIKRHPCTPPAG